MVKAIPGMLTRADSNELWFPYSMVTKQWIVYTEALIHHWYMFQCLYAEVDSSTAYLAHLPAFVVGR